MTDAPHPIDGAFGLLDRVLRRPVMGIGGAEMLDRLSEFRDAHVAAVRHELSAAHPAVLTQLDALLQGGYSTRKELYAHRFVGLPLDAKALAAQYLIWHPQSAIPEALLPVLNLTKYSRGGDPFVLARLRPLEAVLPCERCFRDGAYWTASHSAMAGWNGGGCGFQCSRCGHVEGHDRVGARHWCTCGPCRDERDSLRTDFQRHLWPLAEDAVESQLRSSLEAARQRTEPPRAPPTDLEMKRDWSFHRTALSRVEAELLALHPASVEELFGLAQSLDVTRRQQGRVRTIGRDRLVELLVTHRVLYRTRVRLPPDSEPHPGELLEHYLGERATLRGPTYLLIGDIPSAGKEALRILRTGDDAEFWPALERSGMMKSPKSTGLSEPWWSVCLLGLKNASLLHKANLLPRMREELALNRYAVAEHDAAVITVRSPSLLRVEGARKSVIASPAEYAVLPSLRARFPDHVITPQLQLSVALNLDVLGPHLGEDAIRYLKWCRVDFGVVDPRTGELVRVIEVQAGAHHDPAFRAGGCAGNGAPPRASAEVRDRWKREACALAGIPFEELM